MNHQVANTLSLFRCTTLNKNPPVAGEKGYKFEEILPIYKAVSDEVDSGTMADFMEAFRTFDREGQGYIAGAEMRHALISIGKLHSFVRSLLLSLILCSIFRSFVNQWSLANW